MVKKKNTNFIIIIIVILLFIILLVLSAMLKVLQGNSDVVNNENIFVDSNITSNNKKLKTVQEVVEYYGSKYIERREEEFIKIYINSKYDLFTEDGVSKKQYFYDMIDEIVEIEKDSFYLKDETKQINIYVVYNKIDETYKVIINDDENYYDNTDGYIYNSLATVSIVEPSDFAVSNSLITRIAANYTYYSGTELATTDRVDLGNGYYSYQDGAILARLQSGKALNILFKENYKDRIALETYVTTPLEKVDEKYSNLAFGSVEDGYLGYRTNSAYIFLYEDEVSVYGYQFKENEYFDQYLVDYCSTGNLEKLYENFTNGWTNYFEKEYNPETQSLKITFPSRGIEIDIKGNDSRGIKIYSNYYLTDTVKELVKSNKITLEANKDLIHITEQARRESSR